MRRSSRDRFSTHRQVIRGNRPGAAPSRGAVSIHAHRGANCPSTDVAGADCTTRQPKTRISEVREVCYPWHPWHGKSVLIVGTVERRDQSAFFCRLDEDAVGPSLEVPCWMFDHGLCGGFRLAAAAGVNWEFLARLRALLRHVGSEGEGDPIEDQRRSLSKQGDADAQDLLPPAVGTTRSVSADAAAAELGNVTERDSAEDAATPGSPPENGPRPKRRGRKGGGQ